MKIARYLAIAAVIIALGFNTGCFIKKWSYSFTAFGADLDDWYHDFSIHTLDSDGLTFPSGVINPPHWFSGDVSFTVVFELDAPSINPVSAIELGFSDFIGWNGDNEVWAGLYGLGNSSLEYWLLGDYGDASGQYTQEHYEQVPRIDYDGPNTVKFSLKGGVISLYINNGLVGQLSLVHFDATMLYPTFMNICSTGQVVIKSTLVEYNGGISQLWPIL